MNIRTFRFLLVIGFFNILLVDSAIAWTIDDSYDGQSNGETCQDMTTTKSVVSSDKSASGGKSCKLGITKGKYGFGEWGGIFDFPTKLSVGDEIWVRVRTYFPAGFDYNADPWLKFLRVNTLKKDGSNRGYNDWYINQKGSSSPYRIIYEGRQDLGWQKVGDIADAITYGTWETFEFYIKFDTKSVDEGGTGRMRAWKNGVLLKDMTDRVSLNQASDYSDKFYLFTYWNGSEAAPATQNMYVDDVVITNEKPLNTDEFGNPAIGMSGFVPAAVAAPPNFPSSFL